MQKVNKMRLFRQKNHTTWVEPFSPALYVIIIDDWFLEWPKDNLSTWVVEEDWILTLAQFSVPVAVAAPMLKIQISR